MHWFGNYGIDHYQPFKDKEDLIEQLSALDDRFDAFNDMPYNILYKHYAEKYPDAKFIFVTRDFESWHKSIEKFYIFEQKHKELNNQSGLNNFQKICYSEYLDIDLSGKDCLSKEEYYEYYTKHYNSVYEYFEGSEQFLSVSLFDEDLSEKVLKFLDIDSSVKINKIDFLNHFFYGNGNE